MKRRNKKCRRKTWPTYVLLFIVAPRDSLVSPQSAVPGTSRPGYRKRTSEVRGRNNETNVTLTSSKRGIYRSRRIRFFFCQNINIINNRSKSSPRYSSAFETIRTIMFTPLVRHFQRQPILRRVRNHHHRCARCVGLTGSYSKEFSNNNSICWTPRQQRSFWIIVGNELNHRIVFECETCNK